MSIPRTLEGFDVPGAVERMLGRQDIWWQALALFVDRFAGWEALWRASIGNDAAERGQVHALGSAAANVGADALTAAARALEKALMARIGGSGVAVDETLRAGLQTAFRQGWGAADAVLRENGHRPEGEQA